MPSPVLYLSVFDWNKVPQNLTAKIDEAKGKKIWRTTITLQGADAQTVWDQRGLPEDQLIELLLSFDK